MEKNYNLHTSDLRFEPVWYLDSVCIWETSLSSYNLDYYLYLKK